MATLSPYIFNQYFDNNGDPLNAGTIDAFDAGTAVRKDTFTTAAGTVANANPIVLSAAGRTVIYMEEGTYDFVIKTSTGTTLATIEDVSTSGSGGGTTQSVATTAELTALDFGSSDFAEVGGYYANGDGGGGRFYWDADSTATADAGVVFTPDSTPASGRWIRIPEGMGISILWFGAKGDYIVSGAVNGSAQDNTATINNTFVYCAANGKAARVPKGAYLITGAINCAVSIIGDQKGAIQDDVAYGSATWTTGAPNNLDGSAFVWDKTVLATSATYLNNLAGADSKHIQFKNMTFYSLSSASIGGGKLLTNDSAQSAAEYDFSDVGTFEDCNIVNFGTTLTVNLFNGWEIASTVFRGCKQVMVAGNDDPQEATGIRFVGCTFETCGDSSTSFFDLDNVQDFNFTRCKFDGTSEISIRIALNQGLSFDNCYIDDSTIGSSGDFLELVSTAGFNCDNVVFTNCTGGSTMGDVNLVQATGTNPTITLIDSFFTNVDFQMGTSDVRILRLGNSIVGGIVGTATYNNILSSTSLNIKAAGIDLESAGEINLNALAGGVVSLDNAGTGFSLNESGGAARSGVATLINGTVTVASTSAASNARYLVTRQSPAGTAMGFLAATTNTNDVNFIINSLNAAGSSIVDDDSIVYWQIIEPV